MTKAAVKGGGSTGVSLRVNKTLTSYLISIVSIALVALISKPLADTQNYHLVSFFLLFVVSILSTFMGVGPILVASTLGALVWNYFFIPPHYTFHIEKTEDILILGLFFILALVNGVLTTRLRKQQWLAQERERRTNALFQLTKELSKASGLSEVMNVSVEEIGHHFQVQAVILLQDGDNLLHEKGQLRRYEDLSEELQQAASRVFESVTGPSPANGTALKEYTLFRLNGTRLNPGVLVVQDEVEFTSEQKSYWDTFIAQITNALEREMLGELAQKVRFLDESDRLYKTLFNSISHELRIPVATVMGASDSIIHSETSPEVQKALCSEIFTASLRLNRLIENLLNMSRLESGHISPRFDWYEMNDLLNKVIKDLDTELEAYVLKVELSDEVPLVKMDFGLMEQVVYNLLFNCTQHAPEGSVIRIRIDYRKGYLNLSVADEGPGFHASQLPHVFKKFFRVDGSKTGGLGLGLSIVRGFVEAHNGKVTVRNGTEKGAVFTVVFPSESPEIEEL
jgi:two-component system sensor histidine kinase KdpD